MCQNRIAVYAPAQCHINALHITKRQPDFGIRFLRTDVPVLWGLRQAQVLDLAALAIFLPWLIIRMRQFKKRGLVTELASGAEQEQSHED